MGNRTFLGWDFHLQKEVRRGTIWPRELHLYTHNRDHTARGPEKNHYFPDSQKGLKKIDKR